MAPTRALLKNSTRADLHESKIWPASQYGQAKSAIAADGDGLGRCFIEQFMPSPPHSHTLQNALDSHYAERRKAAAERRKAIAEEQQRQAEAERAEREAAARQAALIRHWRPWEQSTGPKTEAGVARTATGVRAYQIGFNPAFLIIHDYSNNLEFCWLAMLSTCRLKTNLATIIASANYQGGDMNDTEKPKRGPGRPPRPGPQSKNIRIPGPLIPAVESIVKAWHHERPIVFERRQPERQP